MEKNCTIIIEDVGLFNTKIQLIRELREITGLDLKEIKDLVDRGAFTLNGKYDENTANDIKAKLSNAGAQVKIEKDEPEIRFDDNWQQTMLNSVPKKEISKADNSNTAFTIQYLQDVYTLEKEIYCSKRAKLETQNIIKHLGQPKQIEEVRKGNPIFILFLLIFTGAIYGGGGALVGLIPFLIFDKSFIIYICTIIGLLIGLAKSLSAISEGNDNYDKYKSELEKCKFRFIGVRISLEPV